MLVAYLHVDIEAASSLLYARLLHLYIQLESWCSNVRAESETERKEGSDPLCWQPICLNEQISWAIEIREIRRLHYRSSSACNEYKVVVVAESTAFTP